MKIQPVLSIMFLGFHVTYISYTSLVHLLQGNTCSLQHFHSRQKCMCFEREEQEMLLVDANGLVVC